MALLIIVSSSDLVRYSSNHKLYQTVINYYYYHFFSQKLNNYLQEPFIWAEHLYKLLKMKIGNYFSKSFVHLERLHLVINYQNYQYFHQKKSSWKFTSLFVSLIDSWDYTKNYIKRKPAHYYLYYFCSILCKEHCSSRKMLFRVYVYVEILYKKKIVVLWARGTALWYINICHKSQKFELQCASLSSAIIATTSIEEKSYEHAYNNTSGGV